jgi:hypothetical protein
MNVVDEGRKTSGSDLGHRRSTALPILFLLLSAASLVAFQEAPAPVLGKGGPGGNPQLVASLKLPVERTFDLDHVRPAPFAAALGNDPERIFAFVRDAVAFESYRGALRGPRGTLLALAGNSVDRALLVASLLEASGQKVRFAHGTLPESLARSLVDSMWTERRTRSAAAEEAATPPEPSRAPDTLEASVRHNYALLREHLQRAEIPAGSEAAADATAMVREAQDHVWVQWRRGDEWIDLDPSFADSAIGRAHAPAEETWDSLPESLYHRLELRVAIEEQTGGEVAPREVLRRDARAADLSGSDLLLSHQPENWAGPAQNVQAALSAAITDTGRIKPVLLVDGQESVEGQPFNQRPPATRGIGGIGNLLSGAGSRTPVAIAIAAHITLAFVDPGGSRAEVTRELFDRLGPARRLATKPLSPEEVQAKAGADDAFDVSAAAYDLFVTTGPIASVHLEGAHAAEGTDGDIAAAPKRIGQTFALVSDALLEGLRARGVRAYPDSPRVFVADVSQLEKTPRLSFDLRHDRARVVTRDPTPGMTFHARMLRGVVDGVLERVLFEYLSAPQPALSTSLLFELAQLAGIPPKLVTTEEQLASLELEEDARARLHREIAGGSSALVPERPVPLSGLPRSAWWRIDPRSGEVVAVTDEGLHQVIVERRVTEDTTTHQVTVVERRYFVQGRGDRVFLSQNEFTLSPQGFQPWVERMLARGHNLSDLL